MPAANIATLETISGAASFFSCRYRPGATNAQTCHSTYGNAIRKAENSVTFSGTMKGVITPVASSFDPAGSAAIIGSDSTSKISFMNGDSARNTMRIAIAERTRRWRSSIRCDRKLCSCVRFRVAEPSSVPFGVLIGGCAAGSCASVARTCAARHPASRASPAGA